MWPFTDVLGRIWRFVTRKVWKTQITRMPRMDFSTGVRGGGRPIIGRAIRSVGYDNCQTPYLFVIRVIRAIRG